MSEEPCTTSPLHPPDHETQGVEELRGRYGTVRLVDGAPPDLAGRILALLDGEGGDRRAQARSELPGEETVEVAMRVLSVRTADGASDEEPEEIQTAPATMTWSEEDEARASAAETGAWTHPEGTGLDSGGDDGVPDPDPYPDPAPGSGRRRRRGRGSPAVSAPGTAAPASAGIDEDQAPSHPATAPVVVKLRMDAATQFLQAHQDAGVQTRAEPAVDPAASGTGDQVAVPAEPSTSAIQPRVAGQPGGGVGPQVLHSLPAVPIVWAAICAAGHINPPDVLGCLSCTAPLTGQHCQVPLPVLATLNVSTGFIVPVRGEVVVGRAPQPRVGGPATTILVPVPSPGTVISRSHLLVSTAGWSILVQDLGSHNGTVLERPGNPPVLLAPSMPTPVFVGDLLDIGDGATIRVDPPSPTS